MTDELRDLARGRRILVVEDEYLIAADLSDALADLGATVIGPVATVRDALAAVEGADPPDGATLDVTLGQEKSFPVADALVDRGVPVVLLTGYSAEGLPDRFRDVPRCDKPFELRALLRALFA
jgi:CheY-like chemotaxis protein